MRNSHTVSGLAAIATSRWTEVVSAVVSMLALLLSFRFALERLEPRVPEVLDERLDVHQPLRAGAVEPLGAVAPLIHQPRLLEDGQMLRDRRPGHVEMRRDVARAELVAPDEEEDLPPALGGESFQAGVH